MVFLLYLRKNNDNRFLKKAIVDLNDKSLFIQSGAINYLGSFSELNNFNKLWPFLNNDNIILKLNAINSIKNISLKNFEDFKREFEAKPSQFINPALNLFYDLKKEEKKELFLLIKKKFNLDEDVALKTLFFLRILLMKIFMKKHYINWIYSLYLFKRNL